MSLSIIAKATAALAEQALAAARTLTRNGEALDEHQVVVERVAYAATEARVIAELARAPASLADAALVAAADLAASLRNRLDAVAPALGLPEPRYDDAARAAIAAASAPAAVEAVGQAAIVAGGVSKWPLDELFEEVRS